MSLTSLDTPSLADRVGVLISHCWCDYLLFEVTGQRGMVSARQFGRG